MFDDALVRLEIYMHIVIAVKGRSSFVSPAVKDELEDYMKEMVQINGHEIHAITFQPDHAHLLISWNPNFSAESLVNEIKQLSKHYILYKKWNSLFDWQDGYGAFTFSKSDVGKMITMINQQLSYHCRKSFKEEFREILIENGREYKEDDLFEFYDKLSCINHF